MGNCLEDFKLIRIGHLLSGDYVELKTAQRAISILYSLFGNSGSGFIL